jgi:hypothetical protein
MRQPLFQIVQQTLCQTLLRTLSQNDADYEDDYEDSFDETGSATGAMAYITVAYSVNHVTSSTSGKPTPIAQQSPVNRRRRSGSSVTTEYPSTLDPADSVPSIAAVPDLGVPQDHLLSSIRSMEAFLSAHAFQVQDKDPCSLDRDMSTTIQRVLDAPGREDYGQVRK